MDVSAWGSLVALVLVAVFVWGYAEKFAQWMIGPAGRISLDVKGSTDEIAEMAISIAGFLMVVFSIPLLISQTWALYSSSAILKSVGGDIRIYQDEILSGLVVICLKTALGLMLLTTSTFWVRMLKNIREYGLKENA